MNSSVSFRAKRIDYGFMLQTWMYLSVPVILYAGERTLRALRSGNYSVRLLKV